MTEYAIQSWLNGDYSQAQPEGFNADIKSLRDRVILSLSKQGFDLDEAGIRPPDHNDKELLRHLHSEAVQHKVNQGSALRSKEPILIHQIASGKDVNPECISPNLVEVMPGSKDELLFRYAALHWSIPVSSGYGRRIRFLVRDGYNDKLIGIIGLGDPVFGLGARDKWIGWNVAQRRDRLRHILDAYVLGAVPPYSDLLGGKLVAMLATSNEVRTAFERKYHAKAALISGAKGDTRIAMITTTSALGRSSMYNRIRFRDRLLFNPVGYTTGSGEFHFSNGLYNEILEFAVTHCKPTAKNNKWGTGFRNRREVIRKALVELGLPSTLNYHRVQRQVYVAPLAANACLFLQGEVDHLDYHCEDASTLFGHFKKRWLVPRAERIKRYRDFNADSFLLWHGVRQESTNGKML